MAKKKPQGRKPAARPARAAGPKRDAKRSPGAAPLARRARASELATVSSAASALFPAAEMERLKLVALTSARREDKVEALRRIGYSPMGADEKAEIFLGRLADTDPDVRIEAAQLLRGLGLDPDIAEAIRKLEHGDEPQQLFAIDRLGRRMAAGGPLDVGAGLIALIGRLRAECPAAVRGQILERLEDAAAVIAGAPERAEELVRLLVASFASDPIGVGPRTRSLVRRLGAALSDRMRAVLWSEFESTGAPHLRTFILQMLCGLPGTERDARLAPALAERIAISDESDTGFRSLGDQLVQMGDAGVESLLAAFPKARASQQEYIVRLVADACRFRSITPAVKQHVAEMFAGLLAGHQRELQMTVLRTQMPADPDLPERLRGRLADAYLTHLHLFAFPSDVENIEHTVARGGPAAIEPLVERLGPRSANEDRTRAARILGELARVEGERAHDAKATRERLLDILRRLQRWSLEPEFPDHTAVFTAMGKVVSTPVVPAETVELVARNLLERRDTEAPGHRVLEALGYLAASPHVNAGRVDQIEGLFRAQLQAELPDIATQESEADGISVFAIGGEAELYTDAVPAAVRGLAHIALGRAAKPARVASVVEFLLKLWERVAAGDLQWGPPGADALVGALKNIACGERINVALKIEIVRSFAKRMSQAPPLEALGVIFASEDRSNDLGRLAAAAGMAILRRRVDGAFEEEDREHCLRTLASIIGRRTIDTTTELTRHLREDATDELFAGVRDRVPGCYELLARLRESEKLPAEFRENISQRLAAYETLVPT